MEENEKFNIKNPLDDEPPKIILTRRRSALTSLDLSSDVSSIEDSLSLRRTLAKTKETIIHKDKENINNNKKEKENNIKNI
jgi:hypothetical protein